MMCKSHRNLRAACEMYWKRLHFLRNEITDLMDLSNSGGISEMAADEKMSGFEEEMNEIQECLGILEHLFKRTGCDLN